MSLDKRGRRKVSKQSVRYREGTPKRHCGNCVMSHFPAGVCDLVLGRISRGDVCDRWAAKK